MVVARNWRKIALIFEQLTPIFPDQKIKLETDQYTLSTRLLDLVAPIVGG